MHKPILLFLVSLIALPRLVQAAQSYDNCIGFIDAVPAVISTQGTWCLRHDLNTAINSGSAITVATNNVTIDCNDFKLGDLAAGAGTQATGIQATGQLNNTVRHCNVRGFFVGLSLTGSVAVSGGHTIEDNRLDGNTYTGMQIGGDGSVVRRNRVSDTGGSTVAGGALGIAAYGSVDLQDNTVTGVAATSGSNGYARGILTVSNTDGAITGNRVRGLVKDGTGAALAIESSVSGALTVNVNDVVGDASAGSVGIRCSNTSGRARDNEIKGFVSGISGCADVSGNDIH